MPRRSILGAAPLAAICSAFLLLSGCLSPSNAAEPESLENAREGAGPATAPTFSNPVRLESIGGPVARGTEPSISVSPLDEVVVATTFTHLWRSPDGGANFEAIGAPSCNVPSVVPDVLPMCPPGSRNRASGVYGPADAAVEFAADGRLLWAGLRDPGVSVPFQYSLDDGATWSVPVDLADGNSSDRQWMTVGPDGAVHVTWRDTGDSSGASGDYRPRLLMRTSHDHGESWGPPRVILEHNPITGPMAIDARNGAMYVPSSSEWLDILRSRDGGLRWDVVRLPARSAETDLVSPIPRSIFPVAAVDAAGAVYVAWASQETPPDVAPPLGPKLTAVPAVYLTSSTDGGDTWSTPRQVSTPGRAALMPTIVAGAAGRVALAWYESDSDAPPEVVPSEWRVMYAQTHDATAPDAPFTVATVTPDPSHVGTICTSGLLCTFSDRSLGDFFEMALRPNGLPILAWTQDATPVDDNLQTREIVVARVIGGDRLT